MELKVENIGIYKNALEPALAISFGLEYYDDIDIPLSISGCLNSGGKIISFLQEHQLHERSTKTYSLGLLTQNEKESVFRGNKRERIHIVKLTAPLSAKAVEHIELEREKNPEKSVIFNFDFVVKIMRLPVQRDAKGSMALQDNHSVIEVIQDYGHAYVQIKQSDWVNQYSPFLGIGKFILLEFEIPNKHLVSQEWSDLYDRLYLRTQDIEQAIRLGDWTKAMWSARQFYELIKVGDDRPNHRWFEENLKKLFILEQHSNEGVDNLLNAIHQLFEFVSKYIHDKDRHQKLNPLPIPTKEDAYFAFAISIGLLNVIGKKIGKK